MSDYFMVTIVVPTTFFCPVLPRFSPLWAWVMAKLGGSVGTPIGPKHRSNGQIADVALPEQEICPVSQKSNDVISPGFHSHGGTPKMLGL